MHASHSLAFLLVPCLVSATALADDDPGFRPVFDGRTLTGWSAPDTSYWSVRDGAITGTITREHPLKVNQYLVWTGADDAPGGQLADFELKLVSRVRGEGAINNGFQFRSRVLPDHDVAGYQVDNNLRTPWLARLYDEFGRHTLAMRGKRTTFDAAGKATTEGIAAAAGEPWFRLEDWHEYHLSCVGPRVTLKIDGRLACEVIDHDPRRADPAGVFAVQLHSGPPTVAQFKDVRLKVLKRADPPASTQPAGPDVAREAVFRDALARWDLGTGGHAVANPLTYRGSLDDFELDVRADGPAARPAARVALLRGGHFDADKRLNVAGDAATVYLRARDPAGAWNAGLLAKRGGHDRTNVNLYSNGGTIGFEVRTEAGFAGVSFPAAKVDPTAWHDLVGRYDGKTIEIHCGGEVMASKPWAGGKLTVNEEPLLIGAETDAGKVTRPFHGELEEAAVWARALSDEELRVVVRGEPDAAR